MKTTDGAIVRMGLGILVAAASGLATTPAGAGPAAPTGNITAFPEDAKTFTFLRDGETWLELAFGGWGPKWSWLGLRGSTRAENGGTQAVNSATVTRTGAKLTLRIEARQVGPKRLTLAVELATDRDTDLTYMIAGLPARTAATAGGTMRLESSNGKTAAVRLPVGRGELGKGVRRMVLPGPTGRETALSFDPPLDVTADRDIRIILARRVEAARPVRVRMTVDLPEPLTWYPTGAALPAEPGADAWYPFQPRQDYSRPSEISLADWLDRPAGRRGRIVRRGDVLLYAGRPIKLWGLNVCYASCAPEKALAERRAAFYAKYGVNCVRLHKYADGPGWAGIQSAESFAKFDPAALDRMDYFVAQLKARGIYVLLSSTFGVKLGPADRRAVPYMDEFGRARGGRAPRVATGGGSIFLSRELQDLQIAQVVALLKHRNPYTKLTYAADPVVAVVELFNEDSALFYGTMDRLQKVPTLRRRAAEAFCDWLKAKYGSEQACLAAWGDGGPGAYAREGFASESWKDRTIVPAGNPWFWDPDQLAGSQKSKRRRAFDTMRFLYELQNAFYDRYVRALRQAGYEGEILASNWQAGRAFSHYYNLHSDWRVGLIDRHNYFGGGSGAKIHNATMLRVPGSGMLSAGMQQVADRPFMLSEWIHVAPNEWGAEGPAILAAYGMGLNGWDASFMFQNRDDGGFSDRIGRDRWDATAPHVLGLFPAVARQVHRGDVRESDVLATRCVHIPSLDAGRLGFEDRITQQHDVKTFDGDKVPARSLAVARCVVEFTDRFRPTAAFDLSRWLRDGVYTSSTGQLRWAEGTSRLSGCFTMDTPATKAVVGFAAGRECRLGDVTITPRSRFAAVYVTARRRDETLADGSAALIVAIARARNTAMRVFRDSRILDPGRPPIVMEPVAARIAFARRAPRAVELLDHDGCRTGRLLPIRDGAVEIDGARDRTCYYLATFPRP